MRQQLLSSIFNTLLNNGDNDFVLAIGGIEDELSNLRYWPWEAPQGFIGPYPYAVSYIVTDTDDGEITGDITDFEWQITIYTQTMSEGNSLADACKKLFSRQTLRYDGCTTTCRYNMTFSPMRDSNDDPFETTVRFSCYL